MSLTLRALKESEETLLFVGSQGRGVLDEQGVQTRRYWYRRSRFRIITLFTYLLSQIALLLALARSRDIPRDATIFVNTLLPFAAMFWGRATGRTVIVHVHELSITPRLLRKFLTFCASRCADRLLYVSRDHLSRLPIAKDASQILFNPVDPKLLSAAQSCAPYEPRRSGMFRVLMLSSLKGYKGVSEFMAVARKIRARDDVCFDLVLNAEDKDVSAFKDRHADASNVSIYGRTDDPGAFYKNADLVLNLSLVDECIETFGLTVIEAMAFGVPVIAPPIGGPAEIVSHGIEGFCINSRDLPAICNAINSLADDPALAMTMSQSATLRANQFTFVAYRKQLKRLIAEMVEPT